VAKRSLKARDTVTGKSRGHGASIDEADQSANGKRKEPKRLAKSTDPSFMKFTTYVKKATHLGVKTRLVSKEKELSDLVEELLSNWLKENEAFDA
jgi:hypothetical protein